MVCASLCGNAQTASNKLTFQKGKTYEVTSTMDVNTQSQMGDIPVNVTMVEQYTVNNVTPKSIQLTKTPKRMKMNISMMGRDMKADSDNPQDLEGQLGGPMKEVLNRKTDFTVDQYGTVTLVKADEKKSGEQAGGGMMGMMMPGMNMGGEALAAGQPSLFKVLPARVVAKGDTWTDSTGAGDNKSRTSYTVKDITDSEILLDFTGDLKSKGTQTQMGMSVDVSTSGTVSGTVVLDKASGLLKQKTVVSNVNSAINMSGNELTATSKSNITIAVKPL